MTLLETAPTLSGTRLPARANTPVGAFGAGRMALPAERSAFSDYHLSSESPEVSTPPRHLCLEVSPERLERFSGRIPYAMCHSGFAEEDESADCANGWDLASLVQLTPTRVGEALQDMITGRSGEFSWLRAPPGLLALWPTFTSEFDSPGFHWRYHQVAPNSRCPAESTQLRMDSSHDHYLVQALLPYAAYQIVAAQGFSGTCGDNQDRFFMRIQFWVGMMNNFSVFTPVLNAPEPPFTPADLPPELVVSDQTSNIGGRAEWFGTVIRSLHSDIFWESAEHGRVTVPAYYPCASHGEFKSNKVPDDGTLLEQPCYYAVNGADGMVLTACAFNDPGDYLDEDAEKKYGSASADLGEEMQIEFFGRAEALFGNVARAQVRVQVTLEELSRGRLSEGLEQMVRDAFEYAFGSRVVLQQRLTFTDPWGVRREARSTFCLGPDDLRSVADIGALLLPHKNTDEGRFLFQLQDLFLLLQEEERARANPRKDEYESGPAEATDYDCPCVGE